MNKKKLFLLGTIIFLAGSIAFVAVKKPWQKTVSAQADTQKIEISYASEYAQYSPIPSATPEVSIEEVSTVSSVNPLISARDSFDQGLYREAIAFAQKERETNVNSPQALDILRKSYIQTKNFYEAEDIARKLLTANASPENKIHLVEILLLSGKVADAKNDLSGMPKSLESTFYELVVAIAQEDNTQIQALAQKLKDSSDPQYQKTGNDVLGIYDTYASFRDGSPHYLRTMQANILNIWGFSSLVTQFIKPTLEEYPDYRDAWILSGNAYLHLKKFDIAAQMLDKAVSLDPAHAKSPYYLAIALAELGQTDAAIEQFENALANDYEPSSQVERYIGDIYFRQEKFDDAYQHYQVVLDADDVEMKDYARAIYIALEPQNNPDLALKMTTQVAKKFPNDAKSYALLSWALLKKGSYQQALSAIEKGREKDADLPDLYLYAGQIYLSQGEKTTALQSFKECFEKGSATAIGRECAQRHNTLRDEMQ